MLYNIYDLIDLNKFIKKNIPSQTFNIELADNGEFNFRIMYSTLLDKFSLLVNNEILFVLNGDKYIKKNNYLARIINNTLQFGIQV